VSDKIERDPVNYEATKAALIGKAGEQASELIKEVEESPDYFAMQGGSDGTFGHVEYLAKYKQFEPEIGRFAMACGAQI
jgi:hypothetical protein